VFSMKRHEQPASVVDPVIEKLISEMSGYDASDEDYTKMAANLKVLLEAKAVEPKPERINPNVLATIGANLVGIVLILAFEKKNVITSKSLSMVMKPRI
jgi:hypothetical protein